jgi:hypothetical protein
MCEETPRGGSSVAFTSGGTISAAVQVALGTTDPKTLELAWVVRNTALAEFLFSSESGRFSLTSFNALPHLEDPALITHR